MSNYKIIRKRIKECLDEEWKKFIIFPFGENGMLVKKVLEEAFGIMDIVIVDTELAKYNANIIDVEKLKKDKTLLQNAALIIASVENEIIQFARTNIFCKKMVDIIENEKENSSNNQTHLGRYSYGPLAVPNFKVATVGSFCSFAEGCDVVWNHQLTMVTNHDFIYENTICTKINNQRYSYADFNKQFHIGNDVWLGKNVILTNGCTIGNGVRVAAGAVVTKDLPDYCIAAGVPARIIGYRFNKEQIEKLNKIAWWNWDVEKIKACYDDFIDIETFLAKHYREDL